jgi:hypothetical protein
MIESKDIPEQEKVYLQKEWFGGYRVVLPIKNEDGSWNWFNLFGGWKGIMMSLFFLLLIGLFDLGINNLIDNYKLIADNPCKFCSDCHTMVNSALDTLNAQLNKSTEIVPWVLPK